MPALPKIVALGLVAALAACTALPPPARTTPRPGGAGGGQPTPIAQGSYTVPSR